MKSFERRDKKHFLTEDGQNLFELALREAMNKNGHEWNVTVSDFDGNSSKGAMICGRDAYIEHIGVEYHSRWCFYYFDKNGRNFIADCIKGKINLECGKCYHIGEIEAIEQALKNCGVISITI